MWKKLAVLSVAGSLALVAPPITAHAEASAENYPNKPIRFIVGFPPGGSTDIVARIIVPPLSERLGQTIVLDHKAGAGGVIGVDTVAKAAPDGYTMGFGVSGALTANVTLMPDLPYDPLKDVAPISMVISNPLVLAVNSSLGATTLQEFIALAKKNPDKFTYGTAGPGTGMNLAGELLKQEAGFQMRHVPYRGSSAAMVDLMAGHITAAIVDLATLKPHLDSGTLTALGVTSAKRTPLAPQIPTIAESGVPGYEVVAWFGFLMPGGTPPAIISKVHDALYAVLNDSKVSQQLMAAGVEPAPGTPEQLGQQIDAEIKKYRDIIKTANITTH